MNPLGFADASIDRDSRVDVPPEVLSPEGTGDRSDDSDESPRERDGMQASVTSVTSVTQVPELESEPADTDDLFALFPPRRLIRVPGAAAAAPVAGTAEPLPLVADVRDEPASNGTTTPPWPPPSWINGIPPWEIEGAPEWHAKEEALARADALLDA